MYFFDTGLVAYLTKYSTSEILLNGSINGAILENYVVLEIQKSYMNYGKECLIHYYRDKDNNEIDLCMESDGLIHPIEIKKANNPSSSIVSPFDVLKKTTVSVGNGAILCLKETISAINKDNLIIPIWLI